MRRRDIFKWMPGLAIGFGTRFLWAQQPSGSRAAVVIGVDRAGDRPELNAAASGAKQIANWLDGEKFDVRLFVDKQQPVEVNKIFDAVAEFVRKGTISQLVVYFAGHGFVSGYSEYWLLSKAPDNPNEAVSLMESFCLAQRCGIPNVSFISDACRSTADSLKTTSVKGSLIFPNVRLKSSAVDQFLATRVGDPAWEVSVSQSVPQYEGVYTSAFLDAFIIPTDNMMAMVDGVKVVPNRKLGDYLAAEVPRRAQSKSIALNQEPQSLVYCADTVYIGRVASSTAAAASTVASPATRVTTLEDVAKGYLHQLTDASIPTDKISLQKLASDTGFSDTVEKIQQLPTEAHFETGSGFTVFGATVKEVITTSAMKAIILRPGDGINPALIRIYAEGRNAGSVGLVFGDGSGTVLAGLADFVGNIFMENGGITTVNYTPNPNGPRWSGYQSEQKRLEQLRSSVATAAKFGVFHVQNDKEAGALADRIRVLKGIDPTLGIYAAYAYSQAGLYKQVDSVRSFMRGDLGIDLCDVAMLSDEPPKELWGNAAIAPFCPMLSQGWNFLRVKEVVIPPPLAAARNHLRPALWTTFDPSITAALMYDSRMWG